MDRNISWPHRLNTRNRYSGIAQATTGVPGTEPTLRVDMPVDGTTSTLVDVTELPYGRYTGYLRWGDRESVFLLTFGW